MTRKNAELSALGTVSGYQDRMTMGSYTGADRRLSSLEHTLLFQRTHSCSWILHWEAHTSATPAPGKLPLCPWPLWASHTCGFHSHRPIHTHVKENNKYEFFKSNICEPPKFVSLYSYCRIRSNSACSKNSTLSTQIYKASMPRSFGSYSKCVERK